MPSHTFANSGINLVGYTIDNGRLEILSTLGHGAYGIVYLAVDLHAPQPVYLAVKCLLRTGLDTRQRHFQRREIALHRLASRHPNVVTLHKVIEEADYVFVIMDFCDEGDLFGMITERQRYLGNDALIRKVFLQIIDAVDYCHSLGIYHRDLKPENILCTRDGTKVCIADFGLATSERTSTDFGCGSTFYLSPECQGGLYGDLPSYSTESNDIWSLGVILVNLTCGRNPWKQACGTDETFRAFVQNSEFLRTILPISRATNHILKGIFALDPQDRTSLKELRSQILCVDTFTMTEEELKTAHSAARAAAAAVRTPVQPMQHQLQPQPQPQQPVQPVQPVHEIQLATPPIQPEMVMQRPLEMRQLDTRSSSASSTYMDRSLSDPIDFPGQVHDYYDENYNEDMSIEKPYQVQVQQQYEQQPQYQLSCQPQQPAPTPYQTSFQQQYQAPFQGDLVQSMIQRQHLHQHQHQYQQFQQRQYHQQQQDSPAQSRSSSSGDDPSFPPTPTFSAADKAHGHARRIHRFEEDVSQLSQLNEKSAGASLDNSLNGGWYRKELVDNGLSVVQDEIMI